MTSEKYNHLQRYEVLVIRVRVNDIRSVRVYVVRVFRSKHLMCHVFTLIQSLGSEC